MRPPLLLVALSAVLLGACYSAGDGVAPPLSSLYFPTGLALDVVSDTEPPGHLYVASSDFDLQYRASALAAYDLQALWNNINRNCNVTADCPVGQDCDTAEAGLSRAAGVSRAPSYFCVDPTAAKPCGTLGEQSAADQLLHPGRCNSIDPASLLGQNHTVGIGAFATDVLFKHNVLFDPTSKDDSAKHPGRLFLPVRGDATLHWIDVNSDGTFDCGQENTGDGSCDGTHRVGDDTSTESDNNLRQEPEPFAIAIDQAGKNIAVTNQTTGSVSLYENDWGVQPKLKYILSGLPTAPVGIAALPSPKVAFDVDPQPGFLAVYRNAPQVDLLRVRVTDGMSVLTRAGSVAINANSLGFDSRGIAIDDSQREADYVPCYNGKDCAALSGDALAACACDGQDLPTCQLKLRSCLQGVHQPSVYVSNRAPASLLVGSLTADASYESGTSELPAFTDSLALSLGPSRVVLGKVKVPGMKLSDDRGTYDFEQRVFIVCFDSRRIYIYDPARHVIDSIVTTGRGPFALAIDEQRGLGYVAHFTDSYLGVISLDQRFPKNYAAIVASVGVPTPPRASK